MKKTTKEAIVTALKNNVTITNAFDKPISKVANEILPTVYNALYNACKNEKTCDFCVVVTALFNESVLVNTYTLKYNYTTDKFSLYLDADDLYIISDNVTSKKNILRACNIIATKALSEIAFNATLEPKSIKLFITEF